MAEQVLWGPRYEIPLDDSRYPLAFERLAKPPACLYVIGNPAALQEGISIVGARRATPYGAGCARRFARLAALCGVTVISGGARGCDAQAHRGALEAGGTTVAFLGGAADRVYPAENKDLFKHIVENGGALVSEHPWGFEPLPWAFRLRNRLIACLAKATLIVEAGLPSGTFSTADEALGASREVMVVPGAITAASSRGANRLLYQGAIPIVDDESFEDALSHLFGTLRHPPADGKRAKGASGKSGCRAKLSAVELALAVEPLAMDELVELAKRECGNADARSWLAVQLAQAEARGSIARYPDGRFGPVG